MRKVKEPKLKPCPFCGKQPIFRRPAIGSGMVAECGSPLGVETHAYFWRGTKRDTIIAWNRRAI